MKIQYVSDDGKTFDNEKDCQRHERLVELIGRLFDQTNYMDFDDMYNLLSTSETFKKNLIELAEFIKK
jgi:hypothetical protein